jgi:glycosyltransferase involved in cell wall biosynthesis
MHETILFLTRSLERGGAERQLVVLAKGLVRRRHSVSVVVFYGGGVHEAELDLGGVRVINLGKQGRWDIFPFLIRLVGLLRKESPRVLHSYLGVPNILAAVLKPLLPRTRILWGVRASNIDLSRYDWLSQLAYKMECRLARFADRIIANSNAGKLFAVANGFPEGKITVIPNGIDTKYYRFDPEGRRQLRFALGVRADVILVGLVARLDPMKDHPAFLEAARHIVRQRSDVKFVCVGDGPVNYAEALKQHAASLGLSDNLIWLGARDDMPSVYSALDIATSSSSYGEGFSNAIAEAMACGVPCVVTDIGDSSLIVGETVNVVASGDHKALASEIQRLINMRPEQRQKISEACRARVVSEFGIDRLLHRTQQILDMI